MLAGAVGLLGASAAGAGAAALAGARSPSLSAGDRKVLQFALTLEQLQVAFYTEALKNDKLTGEARQFAQVVGREEQAHLRYVRRELGSRAAAASTFHFGQATSDNQHFIATAIKLEETGLAAYNGQAGNVSKSTLASIARVLSVEARHVAWARGLGNEVPAPDPVDSPISAEAAVRAIAEFR